MGITKAAGPVKDAWYHAYVIIDIFSRYIVGHTVERAEELLRETVARNGIVPQTVHADCGTSMPSKPKVSNDNPYSEAQFKTTTYMADQPERFDSLAHARERFDAFIAYYNHEHRHSGIGWHTRLRPFRDRRRGPRTARRHPRRGIRPPARTLRPPPPTTPDTSEINFVSDEGYRRMIGAQLNVTEARHRLARKILFGQRGELRQHYREGMEDQVGALGLALNSVVLSNGLYLDAAVKQLAADGFPVTDELLARLSPLQFDHINFLGRYAFTRPPAPGLRRLRDPNSDDETDDGEDAQLRARTVEGGPARSHHP